jgi:hypothetical protein
MHVRLSKWNRVLLFDIDRANATMHHESHLPNCGRNRNAKIAISAIMAPTTSPMTASAAAALENRIIIALDRKEDQRDVPGNVRRKPAPLKADARPTFLATAQHTISRR